MCAASAKQRPRLWTRTSGLFVSALFVALIVAALLFFDVKDLCAHNPHDPIDALDLSPAYDQDQTLFIVIADRLRRSTDGGLTWIELVKGLDHKRLLSSIAIAPSYASDKTVFVSSDGDGIFRSQDGGDSWVRANNGLDNLSISLLSIYPGYHSDKIVLTAGTEGGLYKTTNGGDSWYQVIDDGIEITAIAFSPDLKRDQVFAGDHRGILYLSVDGGETWQQILQISDSGAITAIAISPSFSSDDTLFVGTEKDGIFKSVDGGASFAEANNSLSFTLRGKYATFRTSTTGPAIRRSEKDVISIAISPDYEKDSTVLASMWNEAVFKSDDGGNTWKRYRLGLTCNYQADSDDHKSPHFGDLKISKTFAKNKTIVLGAFDGLFKSMDGGHHWTQMETLPSFITGLALSPGEKGDLSLAISSAGDGVCSTDDQGFTWTINNSGLHSPDVSDIDLSPNYHSDHTMFSASVIGFLYKSTDGGHRWEKIALGHKSWRTQTSSFFRGLGLPKWFAEFVLTESEKKTISSYVLVISPDFASDNTIYFGTRYHGLFRSIEGGDNASTIWDGVGQSVMHLAISPDFLSDRTLFASVRGVGIFKTTDGGETWQPVNNDLTFLDTWSSIPTVHSIADKDIKLAISPHYEADQTVYATSSAGLFKATDGGNSWQALKSAAYGENSYIIGMAISPNYENDETVIVSAKGRGLFKSEDGGRNFVEIGSDLIDNNYMIKLIQFSPAYATDKTIYTASDEELFKSTDGGNTWERIPRPIRHENSKEVIRYEGEWKTLRGDDFSASSVSYSDVAHAKAVLHFVGTGVSWIGTQAKDQGIARVYVDGNHVGDVDQFGETRKPMVGSFSITDLAYDSHVIVIEATHTRNPESTGYRIVVDAFDILPQGYIHLAVEE
jgi:photosystem II stability/assembly factor-like uncharacterized protein